jgi:hypothetical protein
VKGSLLTTQAKYAGDEETVNRDLKSKFYGQDGKGRKGASQLAYSISRLINGDALSNRQLDFNKCSVIYPIIISYDALLTSYFIPNILDKHLKDNLTGERRGTTIKPVTILSIEDVEALTTVKNPDPFNRLIASYQHMSTPYETFGMYAARRFKGDLKDSPLMAGFMSICNAAGAYFPGFDPSNFN